MSRSHIRSVTARRLDVAMKKAFGISGGAQAHASNVLVTLATSDGTLGYGEGAPFPAFNGETQRDVLDACDVAGPALEGLSLGDDDAIRRVLHDSCKRSSSARCALETALFDARARSLGVTLRALFGGAESELITDITITTGSLDEARHEARAFSDFSTLKMKVGGATIEHDIARVLAVREARPEATILLDANGGFSADEAIRFADAIKKARVALFEQPVAPGSWDALAEVRKRTGLPIAIDESVVSAADAHEAKSRGAADAVNIKIMKSGIFEALEIARTARAEGLKLMIGGMVETRLAMGTSACLAAGLGGFGFIDLDTPFFLATDPFEGGYVQTGERLDLSPIVHGHGLSPRG
jgi:L-alanine-DL-glutamate epimerase-like enolase superfamily enzyme